MPRPASKFTRSKVPRVFDMGDQLCLWSSAGVVEEKLCHNAFDCISCAFDKAMQRQKAMGWLAAGLEQPPQPGGLWNKARWLQTPPDQRWCRHMLSGRVSARSCDHLYQCGNCEFDQMIEDNPSPQADDRLRLVSAAGFKVPLNYYFHPGHTWARLEYGGRVRVGLDDFATRVFGPADEFSLPPLGEAVRGGSAELAFSRDGRKARAVSPVEGIVVARNPLALRKAPLLNRAPYLEGWLLLVEPVRMQRDFLKLMTDEDSVHWMVEESQRLSDLITAESGQRLAATGGRVVSDVFGSVPGLNWDHLVSEFLETRM